MSMKKMSSLIIGLSLLCGSCSLVFATDYSKLIKSLKELEQEQRYEINPNREHDLAETRKLIGFLEAQNMESENCVNLGNTVVRFSMIDAICSFGRTLVGLFRL